MKPILLTILCLLITVAGWARADNDSDQGNAMVMEVDQGLIRAGGVYNILTYSAPRSMALSETGLREAGLVAGPVVRKSDEIRIFASRDVMNAAPLARIWLNESEGGAYWFISGGEGPADAFVIPEGAAVLVLTRAATAPVSWKNVFR